jgi:small basic protein
MTFNVGLFCAVVMGYVIGIFLFSHLTDNYAAYLSAKRSALTPAVLGALNGGSQPKGDVYKVRGAYMLCQ